MKLGLAPRVIAGWLFVVPVLLVGGFWYIHLFVAIPKSMTVWGYVKDQMHYTFSGANPNLWMFEWLVALPVLCMLMSVAYLSNAARSRAGAIVDLHPF